MKLTPIIAALRTRCPGFNANIAGATGLQSISEIDPMTLPAAYVIPANDQSGVQQSQTDYWQDITEGFSVVVVLSLTAERLEQGALFDDLDSVRSELWQALLGFNPESDNGEILMYAGGQLLEADSTRFYYQFDFTRLRTIAEDDARIPAEMALLDELKIVAIDVDYIEPGNGPDTAIEHHTQITFNE